MKIILSWNYEEQNTSVFISSFWMLTVTKYLIDELSDEEGFIEADIISSFNMKVDNQTDENPPQAS